MPDYRIVAGAPASLTWQLSDNLGEPADPGAVTVDVTRLDGSVVVAGGPAVGAGTDARTFALTGAQTRLVDVLTVDWSVGGDVFRSDVVDVVGGAYFNNAEFRSAHGATADISAFSPALLARVRSVVEDRFESWTGQAWVPRLAVEVLQAPRSDLLLTRWPTVRRVVSVDFLDPDGATASSLSAPEAAALLRTDAGVLVRPGGWSAGRLRVVYEHGAERPTPSLKDAAMRLCRELLAKAKAGGLPENAISYSSSELGWSANFVTAGVRGAWTSIPDVNRAISDHSFHAVGIA